MKVIREHLLRALEATQSEVVELEIDTSSRSAARLFVRWVEGQDIPEVELAQASLKMTPKIRRTQNLYRNELKARK